MENFVFGGKRLTSEEQRDVFLEEKNSGGVDVCNMLIAYENLSDADIAEFLAVAFRHNDISGEIDFQDIRLGLNMAISKRYGY
jgi:hypothetical protein